jgi:thiamine-phosphate pyrophosphorylase
MGSEGSINMKKDFSLYLVTEESVSEERLLHIVEAAIKGGVTMVQLREKDSSSKLFFQKAVRLKELTSRYHIPLIINDRVDIALAVEADGVHIGQRDLPLEEVRGLVPPSMVVGVSVSTVEQAKAAQEDGADYIGVGAVFPTYSKKDAKVLPPGMLAAILDAVTIPAVAIGGIKMENLAEVRKHDNLAGIAIVSGIMQAENPYRAASSYVEGIQNRS